MKNCFFALAYFHALAAERKKYGPTGWNIPYDFDDPDFGISIDQLLALVKEYDEPPLRHLRYFVGEINYAGRLLTKEDENTLLSLLDELVHPEVVMQRGDVVAENRDRGHYGIPKTEGDSAPYQEFLKTLPLFDREHIFGFEENIELDRLRLHGIDLFSGISRLKMLDLRVENPLDVTVRDVNDNIVLGKAYDLLKYVPFPKEYSEIQKRFSIEQHDPLINLGNKETEKYSILLQIIRDSIEDVIRQQLVSEARL